MEILYKKARAKINLTLNILDKRPDGYHNLESLIQIISLYDELYVSKNDSTDLNFSCNISTLNNTDNIIYKTYNTMKEKFNHITGVDVKLIKHIPFESGLGGASSDCSAFLSILNKLFNLELSTKELINIAKYISADAPACLNKGMLFATGIGENIKLLDYNFKYYILLIKPQISFSTPEMFKTFDKYRLQPQSNNTYNIITNLNSGNINKLSETLYNSFELVLPENSEIFTLKKLLIENGAISSLMTGSGSCVYGIFDNKIVAKKAYNVLNKKYNVFFAIPTRRV